MKNRLLEKTDIVDLRGGLGATPLMRLTEKDAEALVRAAYDGGVRLFHAPELGAARRIGQGLKGCDGCLLAASVRSAKDVDAYIDAFGSDRIDVALLSVDNGYDTSEFDGLRAAGKVKALAAELRRLGELRDVINSERFDAVAMPLSGLASDEELTAAARIRDAGLGLIALEPLAGGLWSMTDGAAAFLRSLEALPLFGIQYMWQLEQLLPAMLEPPALDDELWNRIHTERARLAESYCRGCGECMPCPAGIDLPLAVRMGQFVLSMAIEPLISAETERKMRLVRRCVGCGRCTERCRHHLPVRALMRYSADVYREFLREHGGLE